MYRGRLMLTYASLHFVPRYARKNLEYSSPISYGWTRASQISTSLGMYLVSCSLLQMSEATEMEDT